MKAWLHAFTEHAIVVIDAIALLMIIIGTAVTLFHVARAMIRPASDHEVRIAWLRYARWLVAALTFQLAADIIETSISTSWEAIGRLGAIALIRTFLNFFLEKDLAEVRALERERGERSSV